MTPNKPETAKAAREMINMTNSALENNALILIGRLADTITYNAEAMNKLVSRVDELEKLVVQKSVPKKTPKVGEYLEELLKDTTVTHVKCTYAASTAFTLGKVYTVEVDNSSGQKRHIRSNHTSMFQEGIKYTRTTSRFTPWGQPTVKPVIGYPLQKLLAKPEVVTVRCVKTNSRLWTEGNEYRVVWNKGKRMVMCDQKHHVKETTSLFVAVDEQKEPCEVTFKRCAVYNTPFGVRFADDKKQLFAEQLRHHNFMEVSRMFMGLPTLQLIHPRSL